MSTFLPRMYDHWMSLQAPAMRRVLVEAAILLVAAAAASPFVAWPLAILLGWDASALVFLAAALPVISRADGPRTKAIATREDENRDTAQFLIQASCLASLAAVAVALGVAKHDTGAQRVLLVTVATLTVLMSWTVVNSVFTLRYADLFYRSPTPAIEFGDATPSVPPDYRDFAYVAFTIGMTYQVSDTTLHDRRLRRTVLYHAIVSYFFGVVIVATGVNILAGLVG